MNVFQKISERWRVFSKEDPIPDWTLEQLAALELSSESMQREHQHMKALRNMPGWEMLEDHIDKQIAVWRTKLEKGDNPDVRANIKAWRGVKNFVLSKIKQDMA